MTDDNARRCLAFYANWVSAHDGVDLDAHPEHRLFEGLDVLADTWLPGSGRVPRGRSARATLASPRRRRDLHPYPDRRERRHRGPPPLVARRAPDDPTATLRCRRGVLRDLITNVQAPTTTIRGLLPSVLSCSKRREHPVTTNAASNAAHAHLSGRTLGTTTASHS
jgi:hypothetical protein